MPLRIIQVAVCTYISFYFIASTPLCGCITVDHTLLFLGEFRLGTVAELGAQETDLISFFFLDIPDNDDENNHDNITSLTLVFTMHQALF